MKNDSGWVPQELGAGKFLCRSLVVETVVKPDFFHKGAECLKPSAYITRLRAFTAQQFVFNENL